jgi:hypothetical protein
MVLCVLLSLYAMSMYCQQVGVSGSSRVRTRPESRWRLNSSSVNLLESSFSVCQVSKRPLTSVPVIVCVKPLYVLPSFGSNSHARVTSI